MVPVKQDSSPGVNFTYQEGKFSEIKTKENFKFQCQKSSSGTLGVNYTFFFRQGVNETKKVKNPYRKAILTVGEPKAPFSYGSLIMVVGVGKN